MVGINLVLIHSTLLARATCGQQITTSLLPTCTTGPLRRIVARTLTSCTRSPVHCIRQTGTVAGTALASGAWPVRSPAKTKAPHSKLPPSPTPTSHNYFFTKSSIFSQTWFNTSGRRSFSSGVNFDSTNSTSPNLDRRALFPVPILILG